MRRCAVDFGIPLVNNVHLMQLLTESLNKYKKGELIGLKPDSLFDYYAAEDPADTWTDPNEYH